jgi:hypothetical protein
VNRTIARLASEGAGFGSLAAPRVGQAIAVPLKEQLMASGLSQGLSGDLLAGCVQAGLHALEPEQQGDILLQEIERFRAERWPALQTLGVFPS